MYKIITYMSTTDKTIQSLNNIIGRIQPITLHDVIRHLSIDNSSTKVDIGLLVSSMIRGVLFTQPISPKPKALKILGKVNIINDSSTDSKNIEHDSKNIDIFLSNVVIAVIAFFDILDYNDDGVVQLIVNDDNGHIIIGADIIAMRTDIDNVKSIFKNHNKIGTTVASIMNLYHSNHITAETDKFIAFKTACGNAYTSFASINANANANSLIFQEMSKDIMTFIIAFCIISIPVIELANKQITNNKFAKATGQIIAPTELIINNMQISHAVTTMYGTHLEVIVKLITGVGEVFVKMFSVSKNTSSFVNYIKTKFCC